MWKEDGVEVEAKVLKGVSRGVDKLVLCSGEIAEARINDGPP